MIDQFYDNYESEQIRDEVNLKFEINGESNSRQNTNPSDEKQYDELIPSLTQMSQTFIESQNLLIFHEIDNIDHQIDEYSQNIDDNNEIINENKNNINNENQNVINNNNDSNDMNNNINNGIYNDNINDVINDINNDINNDVNNDVINDINNDVINGVNNDVINGVNNEVNNDVNNDDNNDNITLLGKRRNDNRKHDKFSDDNSRRKVKSLIIECLFHFINEKIRNLYDNKIGKGICIKEFQNLNKKKLSSTNINFNQEFLHKPIKEIFSEISEGLSIYPKNHNSNLIKLLTNETDYNKSNYFQNLFDLNFLQCLNHIIGTEIHQELSGIKNMNQILDQLSNDEDEDEDYINHLKVYFRDYEDILNRKKGRKPRH